MARIRFILKNFFNTQNYDVTLYCYFSINIFVCLLNCRRQGTVLHVFELLLVFRIDVCLIKGYKQFQCLLLFNIKIPQSNRQICFLLMYILKYIICSFGFSSKRDRPCIPLFSIFSLIVSYGIVPFLQTNFPFYHYVKLRYPVNSLFHFW